MEEQLDQVVSPPTPVRAAEERMLRADLVREMVARSAARASSELPANSGWIARRLSVGSGSARGSPGGINRGHGQSMIWLSSLSGVGRR
jgi:hypothetical protein